MKLKTDLKIKAPNLDLRWFLVVGFSIVVIVCSFLIYKYIYAGIINTPVIVPEESVVRVDLRSFLQTTEYIRELYEYEPGPKTLNRANPFQ
jgi:hypothetical protein